MAEDLGLLAGLLDQITAGAGLARQIVPQAVAGMSVPSVPGVMWHGGTGISGGATGLHLGTFEAARQALNARIGVPASGQWNGMRRYDQTPLKGTDHLGLYERTGYNVNAPRQDYLPTVAPTYSGGGQMPMSLSPSIDPYRIVGPMSNTPFRPHPDLKANSYMRGALTKGNAKRGYYYKNEGEDAGSISATVPSGSHVTPYELLLNLFSTGG